MTTEQVEILKAAYASLDRGDIRGVVDRMNPAIEWHEPGMRGFPPPGGGRIYLGPAAVVEAVLEPLTATWDDFHVTADEYIGAGERIAVCGRYRGKAKGSGRALDVPFVHVWTVRDGTLCRYEDYTDTARILHVLGAVSVP